MLQKARWLDPRETPDDAIVDSVRIPLLEIPYRVYELPAKSEVIQVPDVGSDAQVACHWLRANGYSVEIGTDYELGEPDIRRLWSPNAYLEEVVTQIKPGRALDLACGSGRDSVFMASAGFTVTGIDHLPDALVLGTRLADRYLGSGTTVNWICGNLDRATITERFDVITCFFYLNRELLSRIESLLNPGGTVLIETFTSVHRDHYGKPSSERFTLAPSELLDLLRGLDIKCHEEGWHGKRHTARLWAQKN